MRSCDGELIHTDRWRSINDIYKAIFSSHSIHPRILTPDINMRRRAAKCVPCLLNDDQIKTEVRWERPFRDETKKDRNFLLNPSCDKS
jgi:hypothetical protein